MQIVVCVASVPDTAHLKYDASGQLQQDGLDYVLNPFCEYAVETAVRLKESCEGSTVTVFSLGGANAKEAIKRAIAMGADDAYWLTDSVFEHGDAWTTAFVLSQAIQAKAPEAQVIVFGQQTTDGMGNFTGPAVAQLLGMPSTTFVQHVALSGETAAIKREVDGGIQTLEMTLPGVICTMKCEYEPRIPSIKGVMKANRTEITTLSAADLGLTVDQVSAKTHWESLQRKPQKQGGHKIDGADAQAAVGQLISYLKTQKVM